MKLTTIVAATLPLLAVAVPRSIIDGGHQSDSNLPSTQPQHGDYAPAPEVGAPDAHQPPAELSFSPKKGGSNMTRGNVGQADDGHASELPEQHGLEARRLDSGAIDHYIEECSVVSLDPTEKVCIRNLVVPKGKVNGGCVARLQKGASMGSMHLLESNVMCKYYEEAGCKGRMTGPYTNVQCDYTPVSWYYGQMAWNPQSVFCEIISFDESRWPVNPPPTDPQPPIHSTYDCKLASAAAPGTGFLFESPGQD